MDHALLEKSPFDLSGGEKRRAAIAGVIAMDPDVLVLDEPTAGLDPQGRDHLLSQIKAYHKQRQNTVILVSHSIEDIARVADRVLVMNESKVFLFDETAKVFSHAKELEQIGLRVPQVTKIMMKLHENGYPVDPAVFTLEQAVKEILPLVQRGQYFPGKSIIHKLDPRVKVLLTLVNIVFIFIAGNFSSLGLMTVFTLVAMLLSGVPFTRYIRSIRGVLFIVLFTSILNLFYGGGTVLVQWGFIQITTGGIRNAIFIAVRIVVLILMSSILTYTTSPTQLTDALERLMKPLKIFRIKVHEIAMMMTIALRFVPTLLEETDKIMSAQKARGADLESGGIISRVKALIPVLIPLFVSSFRRAYDLAMAMECRCYNGGKGRTKMKVLHITAKDVVTSLITVAVCAGVVLLNLFVVENFLI